MNQTDLIKQIYDNYLSKIVDAKTFFDRPITYTEKILFSHLSEDLDAIPDRTKTFCTLSPDRVAMQDATAQMALLQFINAGMKTTAVPTTVHCDHLITAIKGADDDLDNALLTNKEVYDFLKSVCAKYGIGFWNSSNYFRKLCSAWNYDDRNRLSYSKCRRVRNDRYWCWRCGRS